MIPVVWVSYRQPGIIPRGYHDQGLLERLLDRRMWRPADALEYRHVDGFEGLGEEEGAVVVVPAQHHQTADELERLNKDLAGLRWVVLVLTGDECSLFPWRELEHPNMALWLMTPRVTMHADCPAFFMGEGYREATPDVLAGFGTEAMERRLPWFFAGQVTHERRRALAAQLRTMPDGELLETPGFLQGMDHGDYLHRMASAKVVPCPSGPCTPDSFRLYEALEAGCLPLADATTPQGGAGFWQLVYGSVPFPVVEDWRHVRGLVQQALAGWPANANRAFAWWQRHKRAMAYRLDDDVRRVASMPEPAERELADLVTVLVPTSPIPSHPSTAIIDETLDSIAERLPGCEVLVMADGVRAAQEDRRDAYEEYLRRLLWTLNHGHRNMAGLVHDGHLHQAEMTRRALELVRTPLVLFVEHDTPLVGSVPWEALARVVLRGTADAIRLHFEASVLDEHRYLMADKEPVDVAGVPLQRTAQWSQRPHLASASWYRWLLDGPLFGPDTRTMIEDRLYGEIATPWVERREWGGRCKLWLYTPEGDIKRSTHLDGRAGQPKWEMTW